MRNKRILNWAGIAFIGLAYQACNIPTLPQKTENRAVPVSFNGSQDSTNTGKVSWKTFFTDPNLNALIDTAFKNNQELNITMQEIAISQNEIQARKGEYLPFVGLRGGAGVEKAARYTNIGASEATTDIKPGKETPDPLPDVNIAAVARWEVDIWHKLRNAKKAAATRYLSSIEGKNFMMTNLAAEIANSYYELLALDTQLAIIRQNIDIQNNALKIVRMEKEATRVTELAVRRFEAQVLKTQNLQYGIQQQIIETENRINFLVGRYPQPVQRSSQGFENLVPNVVKSGIPSQLLSNRPDIKQAELDLEAAKIDVTVARANFYPSLGLSASLGFQAFSPIYLARVPESIMGSLIGDLAGPVINRYAIRAGYANANARQIQAIYNYERTVLNAYIEVVNQLSNINNLEKSFDLKTKEVEALNQSTTISNRLFASARADYMEVLLTQRDALESKFELIETKMKQMNAMVNIYRALGGGWN
ncbi:NodT family efflux transporter outer membrane factor (OMF) lipoprotein [Dyadobacter sp. BE34]|uniref:NodT family efflux transporter outer membrane factor (OMF) lipoprotein n=1 Tax=Dyadobacter fermentans TaxID=94254 RepID=A0ABU1QXM7_9BACT|nr:MULTISPECIES: efflux transporter outer membrane subunit [Dyadobacter]MDR6805911.1 NodT family efflux transporter outer membrane factor (OMF) lipoprotein [Dyadobacter fermentans]MDR7042328.1 NodT family efflux transporter outer membrane factor (OMF) lipoprotein [Dyadobacter sp. BE242]MDR7201326.1 NodT family efflux transporter outer membrane factor (OMF) lipoprotein [Dyadobacter sp. BE34]MDR7215925.1 NodT family efflux transporter outer membrane factor (OMF) lipoprotein [Dyadobacter sp. BE31]